MEQMISVYAERILLTKDKEELIQILREFTESVEALEGDSYIP